ncbi:Fic family protein [Nannocystis bainbridge]|uniref:Fic family protein n=1 Tax=Nannocystis bainbridge TaxID=2995303 RepID=A0ABT5E4F8_9BACT|nr:Fic family protein [Nannocystis bainbridge]MDC0720290.1 Fic family protein [Nannocystis bainbridge]
MLATVPFLRWSDVDPAGHEFDPEPARRIVARHVEAAVAGRGAHWRDTPTDVRDALVTTFEREFVGEYGAWASGWHWAASEPGGGGPVRGWCCSRDSLFRRDDPDPQATVERVVAALAEWQQFLVDLAATFADLYQETAEFPLADQVERAAARLLPLVVERTGTEDAWYNTFTRTLLWCLESFGRAGSEVERAVEGVVDGQFSSWCAPDEDAAREACAQLGLAVAEAAREASAAPPDALAAWLETRVAAFREPRRSRRRQPLHRDGHLQFIEQRDRPRDPVRADRMLAALTACRAHARSGAPLTFAALASWQALVLGVAAPQFRTTEAFARGGHVRYGLTDDTSARFTACLAEAGSDELLAVRAARVYLDVCFFHPFADGNARAARLALDHVITRAGLALHSVEPLFVIARDARDVRGAWCLAHALEQLLGAPA